MALTVTSQPQAYSPAYNPLVTVVSSDLTASDRFNYVFNVYINGVLYSQHRKPASTPYGFGVFDCARIVESFLTHDIAYSTIAFERNDNSWVKVRIVIAEEYYSSGTYTYTVSGNESTFFAFNGSLEAIENIDYSYLQYVITPGSGAAGPLSKAPAIQYIGSNDSAWMHFMISSPAIFVNASFTVTYTNGSTSTFSFAPTTLSNVDRDKFLRVGCGTRQMKEIFTSSIFDNASFYAFHVDCGNGHLIYSSVFYLKDYCKYTPVRIHFLNKYGAFDAFNFGLASFKDSEIIKTDYKKITGSVNSSGVYSESISDRAINAMSTKTEDTYKVFSDWISDADSVWLKDLVSSPVVFHETGGRLVPVKITDTKYSTQKTLNEKLFNLSVSFSYGNPSYRQRY